MKRIVFISLAAILFMVQDAFAAPAEIIFSTSGYDRIQLILDGNLMNKVPGEKVHIAGRPGLRRVQIRVFNQWGRLKFIHHDQVHVRPQSLNHYMLETHPLGGSKLLLVGKKEPARMARPQARNPKPIRHHTPGIALLSNQDYLQLEEALSFQRSDRNRLRLAKRALQHRQLYAEDVRNLMQQFTFESSRLSFAKFAWRHTTDPVNYETVYQALRYDSSIYQLEDFLARN